MTASPFLKIPPRDWITSNALAFAIFDGFPVTHGHALVVTRRLVATWFDATAAEQAAVMELVAAVKQQLDAELQPRPDGYNIGFNCGAAAGQSIDHLHVHVIPRYRGDVADPRGGVRHVIPAKANYLATSISPARRANLPSGQVDTLDDAFNRLQSPARRASPMSGQGNAVDPATPTNISPSPNGAALAACEQSRWLAIASIFQIR